MKYPNKKGQVFVFAIFIMSIIVLTAAYIQLNIKYNLKTKDGLEKKLGDLQLDLIDKYAEGEAYLFYLDQSSKYALDLAFYYLAETGGYFDDLDYYEYGADTSVKSECGEDSGYQIWRTPDKECYPDYEKNFENYYSLLFSEYLSQFDPEDPYFDLDLYYVEDILNIRILKGTKAIGIERTGQEVKKIIVTSKEHSGIIQSGIEALKSAGKDITPVTGSSVHSYSNSGEYLNFENVVGPYTVHVNRKNRVIVITNDKGEIAAAAPINIGQGGRGIDVLADGNHDGSHVTPTGSYALSRENRIPNGDTAAFGTVGVWKVLEPYNRGILIHSGRNSDSRLMPTYGCIRASARLITAMNSKMNGRTRIMIT